MEGRRGIGDTRERWGRCRWFARESGNRQCWDDNIWKLPAFPLDPHSLHMSFGMFLHYSASLRLAYDPTHTALPLSPFPLPPVSKL